MVDRCLIINKSKSLRICKKNIKLISSFLTNPTQTVSDGNIFCEEKGNKYDLPQDSPLSPLLFKIMMNDIFELNLNGSYADDMTLLCKNKDLDLLQTMINEDLNKVLD